MRRKVQFLHFSLFMFSWAPGVFVASKDDISDSSGGGRMLQEKRELKTVFIFCQRNWENAGYKQINMLFVQNYVSSLSLHSWNKVGHRQRETLDGICYENKETHC